MFKGLTVLAVGLLASSVTFAGSYVGIGGGYSQAQGMPTAEEFGTSSFTSSSATEFDLDENRGSARFDLGYLWPQSDRYSVGIEIGAMYLGEDKYTSNYNGEELDYRYYGVDFLGELQFNVTKKFSVTPKLGVIREFNALDATNLEEDVETSDRYLGEVGLGLEYMFGKHASFDVSYYRTFGSSIGLEQVGDADNTPSFNVGIVGLTFYR